MENSVADSDMKRIITKRANRAKALKLVSNAHVEMRDDTSNLATPTSKSGLFVNDKATFFTQDSSWQINVADSKTKIERKPLLSRDGFIYRKARLIHPSDFNLNGDWYILFYTTDNFNEKLIRKRYYKEELKAIDSAKLRVKYANELIEEINTLLHDGWRVDSVQPAPAVLKFNFSSFTIVQAIEYVGRIKVDVDGVKPKTLKEYISTKTTVEDFLIEEKLPQTFLLRTVNDVFIRKYFDYLKAVRKVANKTYNSRRTILHSVFAALIKRDPKLFHGVNPIANVKFLKTATKQHSAYSDDQMKLIHQAIEKSNHPHLLFFIELMYFTLSRPEELRNLKVGDIAFQEKKILFRSEIAKTSIEQNVGINESLAQIILDSGVLKFPLDYFIFSNTKGVHQPGSRRVSINYFYKRIKPIIKSLGFYKTNPNYTLYSFKHTGAIALYKATKDIKLVQSQCRHQSIEQTNTYLRDLGAVDDFTQLNKWKNPMKP